jgi:hypothetical protein
MTAEIENSLMTQLRSKSGSVHNSRAIVEHWSLRIKNRDPTIERSATEQVRHCSSARECRSRRHSEKEPSDKIQLWKPGTEEGDRGVKAKHWSPSEVFPGRNQRREAAGELDHVLDKWNRAAGVLDRLEQ